MRISHAASAFGRRINCRPTGQKVRGATAADLRALQLLAPLVSEFIPWSGSAIAPQTALQMCGELALNDRRTILDLGSGVSTLIMAMWAEAEREHIRVVSIDEDEAWIRLMAEKVDKFDYADVTFVHAPLAPYKSQVGDPPVTRWYDPTVFSMADGSIDMLLVDGPTAYRNEWRFDRWPALPVLAPLLAPTCAVLLDDTNRKGESTVLRSWLGRHSDFSPHRAGPATWLRRGRAWQV